MANKRSNPVEQAAKSKVFSQSVVHPVANADNVDGYNPAAMKVPAGKKNVISQKVFNPVASRKGGGK